MYNIIVINNGNNDRKGNAHVHSNQQGVRDFKDIEECIKVCEGIIGSAPEHKECIIVKKYILVKAKRSIDFETRILNEEDIDEIEENIAKSSKELLELDEPELPEESDTTVYVPEDNKSGLVTAAKVAAVRKVTGAGIMDCKRALMATGGKQIDAIRILRCKQCLGKGTLASTISPEGFVECKRCKGTGLDEDVIERLRDSIQDSFHRGLFYKGRG